MPAESHPRYEDTLFVAGFGSESVHGLHRWQLDGTTWIGGCLFPVTELSALAQHPTLPVVYGVSGTRHDGRLHAWSVSPGRERMLSERDSAGVLPAHIAVDPRGRFAVVANYGSSSLSVHRLGPDGSFDGAPSVLALTGSGSDVDRQEASHPHQVVFHDNRVYVADLGADVLWIFDVHGDSPVENALELVGALTVPAGTGPRHLALLADNLVAVSGELDSTCVIGRIDSIGSSWSVVASTAREGALADPVTRNYPGDIQASPDRRHAYLANRGFDTISTFAADGVSAQRLGETDSGVAWPQHLLFWSEHLLVAGRDSSRVTALPLVEGIPGPPVHLFDCPSPVWLLLLRSARRDAQ